MVSSLLSAFTVLLVLLGVCCATSKVSGSNSDANHICSFNQTVNSSNFVITDAISKASTIGKLQRVQASKTPYGFIERVPKALFPRINKTSFAPSNTWRIVCSQGSVIHTLVMDLQLAYDDYLQIKLKKVHHIADDKLLPMNFSKRSILVSLVSGNRNMFSAQSSFLMGYICMRSEVKAKAEPFFESERVLQYLRCHPEAFIRLAEELSSADSAAFVDPVDKVGTTLRDLTMKDSGCPDIPPCTARPQLPLNEASGSAEGDFD